MIELQLTERQAEVLRQALGLQEEAHKRNDFGILQVEASNLRSYISDAVIDNAKQSV